MISFFKNLFKSKEPDKNLEAARRVYEKALEQQEKLFLDYPLHSEFLYMGVRCRVHRHQRYRPPVRGLREPVIECIYVDKNNVLHEVQFDLDDMMNLNENLPSKKKQTNWKIE